MTFALRGWTSSDGLRLSAREYAAVGDHGDLNGRLPIVCLHGLTRNARDFESLAPVLAAQGRRVLAADVRGRGRSAWSPDPTTYVLPVYIRDVLEMAAALNLSRAVFVGTSMGGLITLGVATVAPGLVAAAVLNDVGPEIAPEGLRRITAYTGGLPDVDDWAQAAAYAAEINAAAFPHYGPQDWAVFARRLFREDAEGRPVLDYDPAIAIPMRAPVGAPAPDLWPMFTAVAAERPVMLVRGETSDILAPTTVTRMREAVPALEVVEAQRVGHAPTLSEPDVLPALRAFLSRAP